MPSCFWYILRLSINHVLTSNYFSCVSLINDPNLFNRTTGFTPFFMVYGVEAVLPYDISHDSPRVRMYEEREAELDWQDSLDALEEERGVAKSRSAFYQ